MKMYSSREVPDCPIIILRRDYPIDYVPGKHIKGDLLEIQVPADAKSIGMAIYQLDLPAEYLIALVAHGDEFLVPNGGLILQPGDALLSLSPQEAYEQAKAIPTA